MTGPNSVSAPNRITSLMEMVKNEFLLRVDALRRWLDPRLRKIDEECGYPDTISIEDYKIRYERGDIAARIVNLYPEECWCADPEIYETDDDETTPFEEAWAELKVKHNPWTFLERADTISGIGQYGVLFMSFDDGRPLDQPVPGMKEDGTMTPEARSLKLLFLRAFDQSVAGIKKVQNDVKNPRYGQPTMYELTFVDPNEAIEAGQTSNLVKLQVHWSRVIHVADNRVSSEIFGVPRMERVYDRLLDLKKIMGGAAEMFWKGGFPGLAFEAPVNKDGQTIVEIDEESTKEQIKAYFEGLQRYLAVSGLQVKSLAVQVADPRPHVEAEMRLIACAMSVPWRVLMGVEVGQLASEQDIRAWNRRLQRRRENYINPFLIRAFIDRLIVYKILPQPKSYLISWPDLNTLSDEEKATVAEKRTNSMIKYVQGGCSHLMPPFHYFTLVLGLSDDEANAVIKQGDVTIKTLDQVILKLAPQPGQSATKGAMQPSRSASPNTARNNVEPAIS